MMPSRPAVFRMLARSLQHAARRRIDHRGRSTRLSVERILAGHTKFPVSSGSRHAASKGATRSITERLKLSQTVSRIGGAIARARFH